VIVLPTRGAAGEAVAAVLTAVGCVLVAGPLGLLWAGVSPRVEVLVAAPGDVDLADPTTTGFIAADGTFFGLVLAAGMVTGLVAYLLGRRHGPGVVLGLLLGGLLGAEVARRTGQLVGAEEARSAVQAGREGVVELAVRLRARSAQVGWALAALATHLVATLLDGRPEATAAREPAAA
jgi:hypothetical protein